MEDGPTLHVELAVAIHRAGRRRRLNKDQIEQIRAKLLQGARAQDYASDLRTLRRVAKLIEAVTTVHYHPRACVESAAADGMDFATPKFPGQGARRGEDSAVEEANLGRGKKSAKICRAWIVFLDESGISEQPPVRRTWASGGQTSIALFIRSTGRSSRYAP